LLTQPVTAQILAHPDASLDYVFPAGGQRGQSVAVELGGLNGLAGANKIVIDGPPGITVSDVKSGGPALAKATFDIAKDAVPGRRWVRVLGGACGLTSARPFFVGTMPEVTEKEPNNTPAMAQAVTLPCVVNARFKKELDVDCFAFEAKAGQKLALAVLAHGMDSSVRISFNQGFVDASLELLDADGKVLAAADDTLGLDPVVEYTVKATGRHVVRLQNLGYKGSAGSVYRLTMGEVVIPTFAFPPGGRRGQALDLEWGGFNLAKPTRHKLTLPDHGVYPLHYFTPEAGLSDGRDLPLLRGEHPEVLETEPNSDAKSAQTLAWPVVVNGRIDKAGDEDWFRLSLKKDQSVLLEVTAQRHLRSPIDSVLEVYDNAGVKLAENDDGQPLARPNHCAHDFSSSDSWLPFKAPKDGDYLVRLRDQAGAGGPRAVYRLSVTKFKADFHLYQWPDAVPIWGPGTTSSVLVEMSHWGGLKGDLHLRIDGLPKGWTGSAATISGTTHAIYSAPNAVRALLTITAPPDAKLGDLASFQVIGKVEQDGRVIERIAQPMTLYGNSHNDGMWLRASQQSRAVVAAPLDCWLETSVKEITAKPGQTVQIPVKVHRVGESKRGIGLVVNGPTVAANNGLGPPRSLKVDENEVMMDLKIEPSMPEGTRGIVVSRSWSSDIRAGRPGPCTPIILLHVKK
jgi:hypothetical protein